MIIEDKYTIIYAPERGGCWALPWKVIAKANPQQYQPYAEGSTFELAKRALESWLGIWSRAN